MGRVQWRAGRRTRPARGRRDARAAGMAFRRRAAQGAREYRAGLRRPPVRPVESRDGRRSRGDRRRNRRARRRGLRRPSQGLRPDEIRPARRRPRHFVGHAARIYRQRGHGRLEDSDHARVGGGRHRGAGPSRDDPARRRAHPDRAQPCPGRHVRIRRQRGRPPQPGPAADKSARRSLHRPALSRIFRPARWLSRLLRGGGRAAGATGRPVDGWSASSTG